MVKHLPLEYYISSFYISNSGNTFQTYFTCKRKNVLHRAFTMHTPIYSSGHRTLLQSPYCFPSLYSVLAARAVQENVKQRDQRTPPSCFIEEYYNINQITRSQGAPFYNGQFRWRIRRGRFNLRATGKDHEWLRKTMTVVVEENDFRLYSNFSTGRGIDSVVLTGECSA